MRSPLKMLNLRMNLCAICGDAPNFYLLNCHIYNCTNSKLKKLDMSSEKN